MNVKTILAAVVWVSGLAASDARADGCTLNVSPSSYVGLGQFFSYKIFNPLSGYVGYYQQFTVVFYGTGISASGETYPGTFGYGDSELTGYQNPPSGGHSGTYIRYASLYDYPSGAFHCTTNTVTVTLQ